MIQHYNDYIYRWQKHYHWYLWRNAQIFTPTSDAFGYNERSEIIFSRGDAEDAEYSYDEIGNLLKYHSSSITNQYVANNLNQYTAIKSTEPIHTAGHWVVNQRNFIEYEYYISGGVSIYEAGAVVVSETFDVMLSFMSFFESPDNEDGPIVEDIENE